MRNYMMTSLIAVLILAPAGAGADTPTADASHQFATGRLFALASFQDELPTDEPASENKLVDKSDQTGTNPINFTFDLRLYNEYQWLNTPGDGDQNITTLEFRIPFADGKWQFRVRARGVALDIDRDGDRSFRPGGRSRGGGGLLRSLRGLGGDDGIDEGGFGDMDFRVLTVPYVNMEKKLALAIGLEVFLDTASEDVLGSGSTSLGPQVFLVLFKPFGWDLDLFAPAYQHKFDVDGDDVNQGLIDLFFLKTSKDKTKWILADPQIILDFEENREFCLVDVEIGTMLDKYLGTKGHSMYVRPSVGIGSDRPYDVSFEIGYKIVF